MKRFGLALTAAILALATPFAASAAPKEKPTPYTKEQLTRGAKEAPAAAQQAGLKCSVADSAFVGSGTSKTAEGKSVKQTLYEVACSGGGLGYIISVPEGGAPQTFDCLTAASGSIVCKLPENADPKQALQPIVAASGKTCTVADARAVGSTPAGDRFFEVKCQQGAGFIVQVAAAGAPKAIDCADQAGTNLECKLTSAAEIQASRTALLSQLVAKSGKTCAISNSRALGQTPDRTSVYEVACGPSAGYMLMADARGGVIAIDCAKASSIGGGCTLTNAAVAQTQENQTYTRLAGQAGFPCNVARYRFIGLQNKSEVVELACSNRPDGGVAVFPADNSRGMVYDCVAAGSLGQRCQFSSPALVYNKYTQALAARGKTTCKVSNARWIGKAAKENTDFIETGCADGGPGWVLEMASSNQIKSLLTCGQAKGAGIACQLPGNTK